MCDIKKSMRVCMAMENMNRLQLGEKTGMTAPAISLIIRGKTQPTLLTLMKLADCFNMPLSEFIKIGES